MISSKGTRGSRPLSMIQSAGRERTQLGPLLAQSSAYSEFGVPYDASGWHFHMWGQRDAAQNAITSWSRLIWPICQQGLARMVCRFSADRSRCTTIANFTSEFANPRASGGVVFALGVASDAWQMKKAIDRSVEGRSLRPAAAQATRSLTTWGAVWAGAELLGLGGALAGIETGPGIVVTSGIGAIVGGFIGLFASNWLARKIESAGLQVSPRKSKIRYRVG